MCSAGITGDSLRTVEGTDEEWRRVLAINADGVFFCNRASEECSFSTGATYDISGGRAVY